METLQNPKEVKAAKEHRCNFCGEKIRVGETYCKSTHKDEGEVYDWKSHTYCDKIAARLDMYEPGEGLSEDGFQASIDGAHDDLLINMIPQEERNKYSDIIEQIRKVRFRDKLRFVINHYAKIDKEVTPSPQPSAQ